MRRVLFAAAVAAVAGFATLPPGAKDDAPTFNRVASFYVCTQLDPTCNTDTETVAEIVAVTEDGYTAVYTDSPQDVIGFVDITNPRSPRPLGTVAVGGEPTSVAVRGGYAYAGVNTSPDYVNPSGKLVQIRISSRTVTGEVDLGGQPDAVAISPDGQYLAVAIENERDEDLGTGEPPQMPAGYVQIVEMATMTATKVELTGLAGLVYGTDPEPEFVAINEDNLLVVTLQENNGIVMIDCATKQVVNSFSAGSVDLSRIDVDEEDVILQTSSLASVPREPDGVTWMGTEYFATADEGDLHGGSRGFTIFSRNGDIVYSSGSDLDHLAARIGHYPEGRSGNKGVEPENVFYGVFSGVPLLFVNLERASLIAVYDVTDPTAPQYRQVLPSSVGPEGGVAVPSRNLVLVAGEKDDRGDKMRSIISIFEGSPHATAQYPPVVSHDRADGTPIPFAALSGLVASGTSTLYAVEDSAYRKSRIFEIDVSSTPAELTREIRIKDDDDILATIGLTEEFTADDLVKLINADKTVNVDPEGIAVFVQSQGGERYLVCTEGSGTIGDTSRPIESLNMGLVLHKGGAKDGVIDSVITLPQAVNDMQLRYGFEGVAVDGATAVFAFQRAWGTEAHPRLGIYDLAQGTWRFVHYPLDTPASQRDGSWVGLSDIAPLGNNHFLVLERDNQGGLDAAIKRVYTIDLNGITDGQVISKTLVSDLLPRLKANGGLNYEKVEGLAVFPTTGDVYINNDNDGVDDNSGETFLLRMKLPGFRRRRRLL